MQIGKTLYIQNRKAWRAWLRKHHASEPEIWLVYYRKDSGKPRIAYEEAVEEALCYGWIDSIEKSIDAERFAQRFSPRRKTSVLSEPNRERLRKLIRQKKMTKAGLEAVAHVFDPKKDARAGKIVVPAYIQQALKAQPGAWKYFQQFPDSYKRIRIAYIESQKKHGKAQHHTALRNFVTKTAQGKRIGFRI